MSRRSTANPSQPEIELEEKTPYEVILAKVDFGMSKAFGDPKSPEYTPPGEQWVVDWKFPDLDPEDTLRDYLPHRFGISRTTGEPSGTRQLLNLLAGKPVATEIPTYDSETFEWDYRKPEEIPADAPLQFKLVADVTRVQIEGIYRIQKDQNGNDIGRRFKITDYKPSALNRPTPKPAAKAAPKPANTAPAPAAVGADAAENPDTAF